MLDRLRQFKQIINEISNDPDKIDGLTSIQRLKLKTLMLNYTDWILIEALIYVLSRFDQVTNLI